MLRLIVLVLSLLVVLLFAAAIGWIPAMEGSTVRSLAFVPYWDQERGFEELERYDDQVSVVGPWWFAVAADGQVVVQHEGYTDIDLDLVRDLQRRGFEVMPAIANHRAGTWDFEVMGELLDDPQAVDRHVEELTRLVVDAGFDGIQLDYENLAEEDADAYVELVRRVAESFHEHDKRVGVAVHAKTGPDTEGWGVGQDYEALGAVADEIHLMAYDYHYDGSEPGPPAPAWWVEDVLDYTASVIPAEKVLLGIGLYGYDWGGGAAAEGLTLQEAESRVRRYDGDLRFDERSRTSVFTYTDASGQDHELWFEDARSLETKLAFVDDYGLGGAFFWRLGGTTPDAWATVDDVLTVER